jgi:hypothetical protein
VTGKGELQNQAEIAYEDLLRTWPKLVEQLEQLEQRSEELPLRQWMERLRRKLKWLELQNWQEFLTRYPGL